ncbi:hypothetical protein QYE76_027414 [Lolium multiflorum]|uniref:Uncharacterized protein n=1 Tax=Lolium multiflorum TaxID=4521 RepID=A0AAD8VG08_LOLMU|nr:hypothetical protein QYE76_027414 [Lolium multiflorum]
MSSGHVFPSSLDRCLLDGFLRPADVHGSFHESIVALAVLQAETRAALRWCGLPCLADTHRSFPRVTRRPHRSAGRDARRAAPGGGRAASPASPSFSSSSEEKGLTAGWRLSSVFFFGEDWGKSFEKEEEEEDIATGGEGFLVPIAGME